MTTYLRWELFKNYYQYETSADRGPKKWFLNGFYIEEVGLRPTKLERSLFLLSFQRSPEAKKGLKNVSVIWFSYLYFNHVESNNVHKFWN